jgi:hypothetical protein
MADCTFRSRRRLWRAQIEWQDEQSVVRDVLRAERCDGPGGRLVVWHAGCVEPGGGRSGRRGVPYGARHAGRNALGERLPEHGDSWDALRLSEKISVRREPRVRTRIHDRAVTDDR